MADKLTLAQFGQRIKSQHSEYSDMDDVQLANSVLEKYPQYRDMVNMPSKSDNLIPKGAKIVGPESFKDKVIRYGKTVLAEGPEVAGQLIGGILGASSGPGTAIGGAALGAAAGRSATNIGRTVSPQLDQFVRNGSGIQRDPVPTTSWDAFKDIGTSAALGAANEALGQGAGAVLGKPGSRALKNLAERQYSKILYPTGKADKELTKKVVPQMLKDRMLVGSRQGLEDKATQAMTTIGGQIDNEFANIPAGAKINNSAIQALDDLKNKYVVSGKVANPQAVNAIEGVQNIVKQYGSDVTPQEARALRQIFDDPVAHANGYAGADLTTKYTLNAQRQAANVYRSEIAKANPDVAALNKKFNFWSNVQEVIGNTNDRLTGQQGALNVLGGIVGAGSGYKQDGAGGAVLGGAGGYMLMTALRSPAWRSVSAVTKNEISNLLASGRIGDAGRIAIRAIGAPVAQSLNK